MVEQSFTDFFSASEQDDGAKMPIDVVPAILIDIADDDPTRGDTAGRRGLARAVGRKIGARVLYADLPTLQKKYPDMKGEKYDDLLSKYLDEMEACPTIIFGSPHADRLRKIGLNPDVPYVVSSINESLSYNLLNESELVSHHLTQDVLEEEGVKFDEHYTDIKKPIISVFLVDPYGESDRRDFAEKVSKIASHYPEATIFLCASRRTNEDNFNSLKARIESELVEINKSKPNGGIDVVGFGFDREATFNPYKGLIARSDHFILWGNSQSMMSEPLMSGKTIHLYNACSARKLMERGAAADFHAARDDKPFMTKHFEPINLTEQIADKILEEYKRKDKAPLFGGKLKKSVESHLTQLRRNHRYFNHIPDDMRQDRDFIKQALAKNGFVLKYLNDEQKEDIELVEIALRSNKYSQKYVSSALLETDAYKRMKVHVLGSEAFSELSESHISDKEFVLSVIKQGHASIYELLAESLKSDIEVIKEVVNVDPAFIDSIPSSLEEEPDLLVKVLSMRPGLIKECSDKVRTSLDIAKAILKENSWAFPSFDEKMRSDATILKLAVKMDSSNVRHAPLSVFEDTRMLKWMLKKASGIYHFPQGSIENATAMKMIIEKFGSSALECATDALLAENKEIIIAAYNKDRHYRFEYLPECKRTDPDVLKAYICNEPSDFPSYFLDPLDTEQAQELFSKLPNEVQTDLNLAAAFVKKLGLSFIQNLDSKVTEDEGFPWLLRYDFSTEDIDKHLSKKKRKELDTSSAIAGNSDASNSGTTTMNAGSSQAFMDAVSGSPSPSDRKSIATGAAKSAPSKKK